jgi:crotonobetainyl-CoA:carnitine CoA-transferase CaiB-like acyl-CoA transferase
VSKWASSLTAEELVLAGEKIPVPIAICYQLTEVANDPQVKHQEMLKWVPSPGGDILVSGTPLQMSGTPLEIKRSFPAIGEHNEEIYCDLLGYSTQTLIKLKKEGVI